MGTKHERKKRWLLICVAMVLLVLTGAFILLLHYQTRHPISLPTSAEGITSITFGAVYGGPPLFPTYEKYITDREGIELIIDTLRQVSFTGKTTGLLLGSGTNYLVLCYEDGRMEHITYYPRGAKALFWDLDSGMNYEADWPGGAALWDALDCPATEVPPPEST